MTQPEYSDQEKHWSLPTPTNTITKRLATPKDATQAHLLVRTIDSNGNPAVYQINGRDMKPLQENPNECDR